MTTGAHRACLGARRNAVVAQCGDDTKNSATVLRVQRQGTELLATGALETCRTSDREELLAETMRLDLLQAGGRSHSAA
ncbi:MAG: hypothetical protein DCC58_12390 [Chloroflexi bacterium]|nr:MAG: hypothetical protein DCC58_12390 [Chloroflexota bacterium]